MPKGGILKQVELVPMPKAPVQQKKNIHMRKGHIRLQMEVVPTQRALALPHQA